VQRLAGLHDQRRLQRERLHTRQLLFEGDIVHLAELSVHAGDVAVLMPAIIYSEKHPAPLVVVGLEGIGYVGKVLEITVYFCPGKGAVGPV